MSSPGCVITQAFASTTAVRRRVLPGAHRSEAGTGLSAGAGGAVPGLRHERAFPARGTARTQCIPVRLIPDQEGIESFWPLGPHRDAGHDSQLRAAPRPVKQLADVIGWSLEGGLDAAVGKVPHPSAYAMLQGHPPAGGAEVDALDLTGDHHPIADHTQTVRHGSGRRGTWRRREGRQMRARAGPCPGQAREVDSPVAGRPR